MTGELLDLVHEDLALTIQSDFGQSVTVINPDGSISEEFVGGSNDIGLTIDPLTGQFVTGRKITIVLLISELMDTFSALPGHKWRFEFPQFPGKVFTEKDTMTDRSMGVVNIVVGD